MLTYQTTLKKKVEFSGIGLHSGKPVRMVVKPAGSDHGIVFHRVDIASGSVSIPALSSYVVDTTLSTTLGCEGVTVATVEHVLAALWGMGIDNADIEVDGPEVPILDGSSYLFVKKFKKMGVRAFREPRKIFVMTRSISVREGDRFCALSTSRDCPKITGSIEFMHPRIGYQTFDMDLSAHNFYHKLSRARTFGFVKDFDALRKKGLIAGGSLDNAVVLDDEKVLNQEGLRYPNEFVRHKMLDLVGDMALFGMSILGHWVSHKSGHALHHQLMTKILSESIGYVWDPLLKSQEQEVAYSHVQSVTAC